MPDVTDADVIETDLAVVAYRDEGTWCVRRLPEETLGTVGHIARELRRYPGESGALAMLTIDEEFVLLVRAQGDLVRLLLSDVTAATDWSLAHSAVELLGLHIDDDDEQTPAGDLAIVADLGLPAADLGALVDDLELYPDEVLTEVAVALGFGEAFEEFLAREAL